MKKLAAVLVMAVALSGCYHTTVNTGVTPGAVAKQKIWAHSWIYGLVPPAQVNATEKCAGKSAAVVEAQMSPANWLVAAFTGGIYTPMTIEITCGQQP